MSSTVRLSNPFSKARSKPAFRIARRVSSFFCSRRPKDASSSKSIEDEPKLKLAQCATFPFAFPTPAMPMVANDTPALSAGSTVFGARRLPSPIGPNGKHQHDGPATRDNYAGEEVRIRYQRANRHQRQLARDYR